MGNTHVLGYVLELKDGQQEFQPFTENTKEKLEIYKSKMLELEYNGKKKVVKAWWEIRPIEQVFTRTA
jgi:hypothetical protein